MCEHAPLLGQRTDWQGNDLRWFSNLVRRALSRIGIHPDIRWFGPDNADIFGHYWDEGAGIWVGSWIGWLADYPNGSTFFVPVLYGPSIDSPPGFNPSLLGATPEQLSAWG